MLHVPTTSPPPTLCRTTTRESAWSNCARSRQRASHTNGYEKSPLAIIILGYPTCPPHTHLVSHSPEGPGSRAAAGRGHHSASSSRCSPAPSGLRRRCSTNAARSVSNGDADVALRETTIELHTQECTQSRRVHRDPDTSTGPICFPGVPSSGASHRAGLLCSRRGWVAYHRVQRGFRHGASVHPWLERLDSARSRGLHAGLGGSPGAAVASGRGQGLSSRAGRGHLRDVHQ